MSSSPKILVTGATGSIGSAVVDALAKKGVSFRAGVHNVSKADKWKSIKGAEIVELDLRNPDSIAKALQGIEKLFLLSPPGQTDVIPGVLEQAKKAGVKHIVRLSALGAEEKDRTLFVWAAEHKDAEDLISKSGIALTAIRPSAFSTNLFHDAKTIKENNSIFHVNANTNYISVNDIGEVAAIALTTSGHEGKVYSLTGPDTLSYQQVAQLLSDELGRKITQVPLSEEDLKKNASTFLPPQGVEPFCNMIKYLKNGGHDRPDTGDVEKVTGHKGQSLKDWLHQNADALK